MDPVTMQLQHAPLTEAKRLLDSKQIRLLSLDIFDTTVWRCFPQPADLFYALGARMIEAGTLYASMSAASFAGERVAAEQAARLQNPSCSEVNLEEIYTSFPSGLLRPGRTVADLVSAELQLERESTFHDESMVDLIGYAAAKGIATAYVSDTYFDESHLRAILPRDPFLIINSCGYRKPKVHGLHAELIRQRDGRRPRFCTSATTRMRTSRRPASSDWRPSGVRGFRSRFKRQWIWR